MMNLSLPQQNNFNSFHDRWNSLHLARRAIERPEMGQTVLPYKHDFVRASSGLPGPAIFVMPISGWLQPAQAGKNQATEAGTCFAEKFPPELNFLQTEAPEEYKWLLGLVASKLGHPNGVKVKRTFQVGGGNVRGYQALLLPLAAEKHGSAHVAGLMQFTALANQGRRREQQPAGWASSTAQRSEVQLIDVGTGLPALENGTPRYGRVTARWAGGRSSRASQAHSVSNAEEGKDVTRPFRSVPAKKETPVHPLGRYKLAHPDRRVLQSARPRPLGTAKTVFALGAQAVASAARGFISY